MNTESPAREVTAVDTGVGDVVADGRPQPTMEVLRSHVPLSLLMDLASSEGPDSARIAAVEGGDAGWLKSSTPR